MSDDKSEQPLPASGDLPFKEPGFAVYAPADWGARAWAFKRAADMLASHVLDTYTAGDLLIYAIAFLYRHQLELSLKEIIVQAHKVLDKSVEIERIHRLSVLWGTCREAIESAGFSVDIPETEHFESCIKQLDALDPASTLFRYPSGASPTSQSIDLQNLKTVMDRMCNFLDATRDQLVLMT